MEPDHDDISGGNEEDHHAFSSYNGGATLLRHQQQQHHSSASSSNTTATNNNNNNNITNNVDEVGTQSVAVQLQSVQSFIELLEICWRDSVVRNLEGEREMRAKQTLIADARAILRRKQEKLDLVKGALMDVIQQQQQIPHNFTMI